jgi:hypothetical protein
MAVTNSLAYYSSATITAVKVLQYSSWLKLIEPFNLMKLLFEIFIPFHCYSLNIKWNLINALFNEGKSTNSVCCQWQHGSDICFEQKISKLLKTQ